MFEIIFFSFLAAVILFGVYAMFYCVVGELALRRTPQPTWQIRLDKNGSYALEECRDYGFPVGVGHLHLGFFDSPEAARAKISEIKAIADAVANTPVEYVS